MKFTIFATVLASAAAFAPSTVERTSSALNMDRRAAFGQIAAAGAVLAGVPAIASADGAVSTASIQRARGVYGDRIVALKSAVEKGDFAAIADEKNAFILFNSGAYPKDKAKKAAAIAGTNAIFAAIRARDKAGVKSAYDAYVKDNSITGFAAIDNTYGQGYSSDYDYRVKTKSG
jgi:hypothetical protein